MKFTDDEMIVLCRAIDIAESYLDEYMCPGTRDYDKKYCKLFEDLQIKINDFLKSQSVINDKDLLFEQLDELIKDMINK